MTNRQLTSFWIASAIFDKNKKAEFADKTAIGVVKAKVLGLMYLVGRAINMAFVCKVLGLTPTLAIDLLSLLEKEGLAVRSGKKDAEIAKSIYAEITGKGVELLNRWMVGLEDEVNKLLEAENEWLDFISSSK